MSSATNPLLRRVQGSTRATDLASARDNLRSISTGGRPASRGSARRTASPRGATGRVGARAASQSGDDYGSGARDRSRERSSSRIRPAGPETAMDWAQAIEQLENRIETLDRNAKSYVMTIAEQSAKIEALMTTVQFMNTDVETLKGRIDSEHTLIINLERNVRENYSTTLANRSIQLDMDARIETLGIQCQYMNDFIEKYNADPPINKPHPPQTGEPEQFSLDTPTISKSSSPVLVGHPPSVL